MPKLRKLKVRLSDTRHPTWPDAEFSLLTSHIKLMQRYKAKWYSPTVHDPAFQYVNKGDAFRTARKMKIKNMKNSRN